MKNWNNPQSGRLRGAVVGVGYLGTFHAQKYMLNSSIEMVGVCDFNRAQAAKVADQLKVKAWNSPEDLLGQVDLVTIAASTQAHYELCKLFLNAGIAVNVEKPLAARLDQAEELVQIANTKKVPLAVGHIERFNPTIIALKRALHRVGKIKIIDLQRMGAFRKRGSDVNVLYDLAIHDVDLLYWLTGGAEVQSFKAQGAMLISGDIDTASMALQMDQGILGTISVSRTHSQVVRGLRVVGSEGVLIANTATGTLDLVIKNSQSSGENDLQSIEPLSIEKGDALQSETNAFIQALLDSTPLPVSGLDGLRAMRLIAKIQDEVYSTLR